VCVCVCGEILLPNKKYKLFFFEIEGVL
jgi:hypothetical protein